MRNYEGTLRLQGLGIKEGIKAKNIKVGDVLVWNYGGTELVKEITFSKTGKTLVAVVECNGQDYERKMTAERIVIVQELNPVKEEEVVVEAKELIAKGKEIEATIKNMEVEEAIVVIDQYLEEVAKVVNDIEDNNLRYELRDIENPLKWTLCNLEELAKANKEEAREYGKEIIVKCVKGSRNFKEGNVYKGTTYSMKGVIRLIGDNGKPYIVKEERFEEVVDVLDQVKKILKKEEPKATRPSNARPSVRGFKEQVEDALASQNMVLGCWDDKINSLSTYNFNKVLEAVKLGDNTEVLLRLRSKYYVAVIEVVDNELDIQLCSKDNYIFVRGEYAWEDLLAWEGK